MVNLIENTPNAKYVRRLAQLERTLLELEVISSRRFGCSLQELRAELYDRSKGWSTRTLHRDLSLLQDLGFIVRVLSTFDQSVRFKINPVLSIGKFLQANRDERRT